MKAMIMGIMNARLNMTKHTDQAVKDEIIRAFTQDLEPVIGLAATWGLSRQAVYKILKQAEVNTAKGKVKVSCSACGGEVLRPKSKLRDRKHIFCNHACHNAYRSAVREISTSRAMWHRVARRKIQVRYPKLKKSHVVHFIDGKVYNCMETNLMVFKNLGDHARWHRSGINSGVEVLWRGDE